MEEAVGEALLGTDEPKTRESLVHLKETVRSAGLIRLQLVTDINVAPERFIEAQRAVFRARRLTGLPDLEPQLLPQLVELPTQILSAAADVFKTSGSLGERCAKRCKKQELLQQSTSATWTRRACRFRWTSTVPSSQAIRPFLRRSRCTAGCLRTVCGVKNPSVQPM